MRKITVGMILRDIRIRSGTTLRRFCRNNNLDPIRFSLIERDELEPNLTEYGEYISLVRLHGTGRKDPSEMSAEEIMKEIEGVK